MSNSAALDFANSASNFFTASAICLIWSGVVPQHPPTIFTKPSFAHSSKICAVSSGKVVVAKAGQTGYGNYVVIEHNSEDGTTFYTLYGHMKQGSLMVAEGTDVKVGQVLGIMGSTGNSTGAHLHFEIRINKNSSSNAVDPYTYLFGN